MITCSWCGSDGPFAQIAWGSAHVPSSYCARCEIVRAATGAFPPRTPDQKRRAVTQAHRRIEARKLGA